MQIRLRAFCVAMIAALVLSFIGAPAVLIAGGDSCKPDVNSKDRDTKEPLIAWTQSLSATGMLRQIWKDQAVNLTLNFIMRGGVPSINLDVVRQDGSFDRAVLADQLRGDKSVPVEFLFGEEESVMMPITKVRNSSGTTGFIGGEKAFNAVFLQYFLKGQDYSALKQALIERPVKAVHVGLAGDVEFTRGVSDKDAERLQQKAACFFATLPTPATNPIVASNSN